MDAAATARARRFASRRGPDGEAVAGPASPAAGRVDLLTVLEHELGHVIGLADNPRLATSWTSSWGSVSGEHATGSDVAAIVEGSSTLHSVSAASAIGPVPTALLPPGERSRRKRPISNETVDAALAFIVTAAGDDLFDPMASDGRTGNLPGPVLAHSRATWGEGPETRVQPPVPARTALFSVHAANSSPGRAIRRQAQADGGKGRQLILFCYKTVSSQCVGGNGSTPTYLTIPSTPGAPRTYLATVQFSLPPGLSVISYERRFLEMAARVSARPASVRL